jgi:hypothetical protein
VRAGRRADGCGEFAEHRAERGVVGCVDPHISLAVGVHDRHLDSHAESLCRGDDRSGSRPRRLWTIRWPAGARPQPDGAARDDSCAAA